MSEFSYDHRRSIDAETDRKLNLLVLQSEIDALQEAPQTPLIREKIEQLTALKHDLLQNGCSDNDEEIQANILEATRGPLVRMMILMANLKAFEENAPWN